MSLHNTKLTQTLMRNYIIQVQASNSFSVFFDMVNSQAPVDSVIGFPEVLVSITISFTIVCQHGMYHDYNPLP